MDYRIFLGILALLHNSLQDINSGVNLVTQISNKIFSKLLTDITTKNPQENVVINAFGLSTNLALLIESTNGKSRQELLKAFNVSSTDNEDIRLGFKAYCELFVQHSSQSDTAGTFNAVFLKTPQKLIPSMRNIYSKYYCVNVSSEDISTSDSALTLRSDSGILSHWKDFDKIVVYTFLSHRPLVPFYNGDSSVVHVPMIPLVGVFKNMYMEEYQSKAVLLPLESRLANLLLIIPNNEEAMKNLTKNFKKLDMSQLVDNMFQSEVEIFIPQFHAISKDFDLTPYVKRLGVRLVFDSSKADFSRASDKNNSLYLSSVTQNSFLTTSFNSLNSVSAAMSHLDSKIRKKREARQVSADRPFLFFVLHKDTNLVLLGGKIVKPSQIPPRS